MPADTHMGPPDGGWWRNRLNSAAYTYASPGAAKRAYDDHVCG